MSLIRDNVYSSRTPESGLKDVVLAKKGASAAAPGSCSSQPGKGRQPPPGPCDPKKQPL
jgi:hypothetical protein